MSIRPLCIPDASHVYHHPTDARADLVVTTPDNVKLKLFAVGSLFVWLRRVVLDTLADFHCRHLGTKMRNAGQEVLSQCPASTEASSLALVGCLAGDSTSPSQAAMREEIVAQVARILDRMPPTDREVLILRHLEELSNDEVAAVLGVKKAAASRRHMRALARFRDVLRAIPGFEQ